MDAPQLAGRERSAAAGNAWGDEIVPAAGDISHQDKQSPSAAAQSAPIEGKVSGMTQSEAQVSPKPFEGPLKPEIIQL